MPVAGEPLGGIDAAADSPQPICIPDAETIACSTLLPLCGCDHQRVVCW
jgi:hypothetical protein